jgi:anti-anti-sigma factor
MAAGLTGRWAGYCQAFSGGMPTRQCAGQVVVARSGELDVTDAVRIGALVTTVAIRVPWRIVDLAALEFADCAGLGALAANAKQARQAGPAGRGWPGARRPGPLVLRVLDLTGLMTGVPLYSSVEEAAGVASRQRAAAYPEAQTGRLPRPGCPLSGPNASRKKGGVTPTSSPLRLTRGLIARDRTGRQQPGPAWPQGTR